MECSTDEFEDKDVIWSCWRTMSSTSNDQGTCAEAEPFVQVIRS